MGVEIRVEHLTKRFGRQTVWEDVSLTLPKSEISVLLGPSGTGKSVFLKCLIGLLKPNNGSIYIDGADITRVKEHKLYEIRKLFGVLFQDGALFGSQSIFDNIAFPLREHTKKREGEIKNIVMEKIEMVGLLGAERKLPGEISGGMRKRAGLARALVLDPEIILCDEPDSGLDPVRTAYLNQLIVDLNAQIEATFLIVTHDINTARSLPDNIGLLYRRHLAMFGPRLQLLTSPEPVVRQFLNGQRQGPIGMAEEKDAAQLAEEADSREQMPGLPPLQPQLVPSDGGRRRTQRGPLLKEPADVVAVRNELIAMAAGRSDGRRFFVTGPDGTVVDAERAALIVGAAGTAAPATARPAPPVDSPRSNVRKLADEEPDAGLDLFNPEPAAPEPAAPEPVAPPTRRAAAARKPAAARRSGTSSGRAPAKTTRARPSAGRSKDQK